jgi:hypothetical protein
MLFSTRNPTFVRFGGSIASAMRRAAGPLALVGASVTCLTGCPNVQRELEDFEEREIETRPPPPEVQCGTAATEIEGQFVFALSTELGPTTPLMFLTEITTEADGLSFAFTPLSKDDRKTPVGDEVVVSGYPIDAATGTFEADLPLLKVPGAGNPITGTDIEADIALAGAACEDVLCGAVSGQVIKPIDYTLKSSTFYMQRIPEGEEPPAQPFIDCDKKQAAPL